MKKIFWIAGENSGDIHSAIILRELQNRGKDISVFGIGGPNMIKYNFTTIEPFERFAVMGFTEVVKHIFFFTKIYFRIKKIFKKNTPDLIVLTDYPGFNMKLAKLASKFNIPVLYYISPQFWAWKQNRIFQLKKYTDYIAYILPFEGNLLQKENVHSSYVGHPIAEEIELKLTKKEFAKKFQLDETKKWLGFFPGSRANEIKRLSPEFINAINHFNPDKYEFLVSRACSINKELFKKMGLNGSKIKEIDSYNYEMMKYCDFLTITSGTATLECAYLGTPFIIVYKTSRISYELGKRFVKIDKIGLPNIILGNKVLPELLQDEVNGRNIYYQINLFLKNPKKYAETKDNLKTLHDLLEKKSTSKAVSDIIENMLYE